MPPAPLLMHLVVRHVQCLFAMLGLLVQAYKKAVDGPGLAIRLYPQARHSRPPLPADSIHRTAEFAVSACVHGQADPVKAAEEHDAFIARRGDNYAPGHR